VIAPVLQQVTNLARIGLKGPNAAAWLQQQGIAIPERANSWCLTSEYEQDINVRLGASEFLLEQTDGHALRKLNAELATYVPGVYPVLREDRAFVLAGEGADDVLAQMCNVNFAALRAEAREAIMTLMIGVAVTVVPQGNAAHRRYRIWCDPSYGDYLWSSLQDVAQPILTDTTNALGGIR
jgi:sarcosine oxidase, subunit gamma